MSVRFDLQSHSVHSDGELSAADVVASAAAAGQGASAVSSTTTSPLPCGRACMIASAGTAPTISNVRPRQAKAFSST